MEHYKNIIVKIHSVNSVLDIYSELKRNDYEVILVSDIDDTILSSTVGKKFVENEIKILIEQIYLDNPDHLIFLTARDKSYKRKTNHHLNSASMHKKDKYINYNILCSPYDDKGNPTKGETFIEYFENELIKTDKKIWFLFMDDSIDQIYSIYNCIEKLNNIQYTIFHYQYAQIKKIE